MPIFSTPVGLLLFAHVPKAGGTSIESILTQRFRPEPVAFLDNNHGQEPRRWSRTSPQHLEAAAMARLFPEAMFVLRLALLRHPATRIRSAYLHHRDIEGRIDEKEDFDAWLAALPERRQADPWYLDNHPRPICEMVPEKCQTFKLEEDGIEAAVSWVDAHTGGAGMPTQRRRYGLAERLEAAGRKAGTVPELTKKRLAEIRKLYAQDYERFGYDTAPPASGG